MEASIKFLSQRITEPKPCRIRAVAGKVSLATILHLQKKHREEQVREFNLNLKEGK